MKNKKKIALVTMAKDEDLYLQEWIDYHLKLGFDDIFIYQNNWRFNAQKPDDRVHFLEWDKPSLSTEFNNEPWKWNRHAMCYNNFGQQYYEQYQWAAFLDVDCLLVLKQTSDVKKFISEFDDVKQSHLVINMAMFGDGGHEDFDKNNVSLLERFTKRWGEPYTHTYYNFLPICKLHKDFDRHSIHFIEGEDWIDVDMTVGRGIEPVLNQTRHVSYDKAQLNHYYTKTWPEWQIKCNKTRAEGDNFRTPIELFNSHNHNDIEDLHALNFFKNR